MIEVTHLTRHYGEVAAVDDLTFSVRPGIVTGFLGPNGAGKSTTMRMLVGLESPTSGRATINGRSYREHRAPLTEIGVLLDARAAHPGRSARNHLLAIAATHSIAAARVDHVLDVVGLTEVAGRRVGSFSLGMGQRLGIAAALLGDPHTIMLDEPVNGLDPEGIHWIRDLLKGLAADGRTVFVSSHLMSEMALTAEHLVVVGRGRLIADLSVADLISSSKRGIRVRTSRPAELTALLQGRDVRITSTGRELLDVTGRPIEEIALFALSAGIPLFELTPLRASLEEAYMDLTRHTVDYFGKAA
jgi:ABC-2 type transport system ATP-binding protein